MPRGEVFQFHVLRTTCYCIINKIYSTFRVRKSLMLAEKPPSQAGCLWREVAEGLQLQRGCPSRGGALAVRLPLQRSRSYREAALARRFPLQRGRSYRGRGCSCREAAALAERLLLQRGFSCREAALTGRFPLQRGCSCIFLRNLSSHPFLIDDFSRCWESISLRKFIRHILVSPPFIL